MAIPPQKLIAMTELVEAVKANLQGAQKAFEHGCPEASAALMAFATAMVVIELAGISDHLESLRKQQPENLVRLAQA
jgi:hypothetical protein